MWRIAKFFLGGFLVSVLLVNVLGPALGRGAEVEPAEAEALLERYTSEMVCGERIRCIDDNEEALLWRLRMIAGAEESIVLSTFDLRADESGTDIMAALYDAAERGVRIRLLVDGTYQVLFLKNADSYQALCAHENVEARSYNPVGLRNIYRLNYRMHDKYLMVDERMYLLGGRNVNDIFLGDYPSGKNVDRDILVYETEPGRGQSWQQLCAYFAQIWEEPCVSASAPGGKAADIERGAAALRERYAGLQERMEAFEVYDSWLADTYAVNRITLLTNETGAGRKSGGLWQEIQALALTGEDVLIQTPYVICDRSMYDGLAAVAEQAGLRILLNAVEKGSNPWGCTDYLNNQEKILATGATVYEVMNDRAVHTKTVVIDDRLSIVGSYNLDMRSTYLDTEMMLIIDSSRLNAHIRQMADIYMEKSLEVLPDGTKRVGEQYVSRELSNSKRLFYLALRILIRPLRHLL